VAYASVVAITQLLCLTFTPIDTGVARDFSQKRWAARWWRVGSLPAVKALVRADVST